MMVQMPIVGRHPQSFVILASLSPELELFQRMDGYKGMHLEHRYTKMTYMNKHIDALRLQTQTCKRTKGARKLTSVYN